MALRLPGLSNQSRKKTTSLIQCISSELCPRSFILFSLTLFATAINPNMSTWAYEIPYVSIAHRLFPSFPTVGGVACTRESRRDVTFDV